MLLDGKQLQFYEYAGDVNELLDGVRGSLNSLAEGWSRDQKDVCLKETLDAFSVRRWRGAGCHGAGCGGGCRLRQAGRQAGRRAGGQAGRRAGGQAGRRAGGQAGRRAGAPSRCDVRTALPDSGSLTDVHTASLPYVCTHRCCCSTLGHL
jgi:hypothetical protein